MNLATQPWVRVLDTQNRLLELSLYDVIAQAHRIKVIHGSTSLERVSLFRLILALLYRTSQPVTEDDAERILRSGWFDTDHISHYLTHWQDRFNLFDKEYPFYQFAEPPAKLKPRNINRLFLHHSTGTKGTMHSHIHDGTVMNFTPAQAARAVVMAQCFLTSGGNSGRAGQMFRHTAPLRQTNFILQGQTLFETLWIHLFPKSIDQELSPFFPRAASSSKDRPIWERNSPEIPLRNQPQGPLDILTFPCRVIKLLPEADLKVINQTLISQSLWIKENVPLFDPLAAYRLVTGKDGGESIVYPVKIERGFLEEPLLLDPNAENLVFPVFNRWRRAVRKGLLDPNHVLFIAIGVECDRTNRASIHQIYNHHLQLPGEVLVDEERFNLFKQFSEDTQSWTRIGDQALRGGIKTLHKSRRKGFQSLPGLLQKQIQHLAECWLPRVVLSYQSLDWEREIWKMVDQHATVLPFKAKVAAINRFNQLRAKKRNEELNNRGDSDE